ncbi:MAG: hypothetical protein ACU0A4_09435 [Paracoccaceae bacterium]
MEFLTTHLSARKQIVNVWNTPQFKAIEWLARQDRLRFPPDFDLGLHGAFCKILSMEAICRSPLLQGDILTAMEQIEKASKKLFEAADDLFLIHQNVLDALEVPPHGLASKLAAAQDAYSGGLGDVGGFLKAELDFRERILGRFGGSIQKTKGGRPVNWVARLIATYAADIYRTAYPGEITKGDGRPSFESFLERFSVSFPDAERADTRRLARSVWKGEYKGVPFAPVAGVVPERGGAKPPQR